MSVLRRLVPALALAAAFLIGLRFLQPPAAETAKLKCVFTPVPDAIPAELPYSSSKVSKIDFEADLTGKSIEDGIILWHSKGLARLPGGTQNLAGSVFVSGSGEVIGLGLYRDQYPNQKDDLRVSTLNENGKLDWNSETAFVYFQDAPNKLAHRYAYHCNVTDDEGA